MYSSKIILYSKFGKLIKLIKLIIITLMDDVLNKSGLYNNEKSEFSPKTNFKISETKKNSMSVKYSSKNNVQR